MKEEVFEMVAEILMTGCHVGELSSLEAAYDLLQDFPYLGGSQIFEPIVKRFGRNSADGISGSRKIGCEEIVEMTTSPQKKTARIRILNASALSDEYKAGLLAYLKDFFGPKEIDFV